MNNEDFNDEHCAYIYVHINKLNHKKYVGQTCKTPKQRWGKYGERYVGSTYFYKAIQKYGWNNFKHVILAVVPESFADTMEKYFIAKYNSNNQMYGYNLDSGGNKEKHHSKETIRKIRENNKGKKMSLYCLLAIKKANIGRKASLETINKMSKAQDAYKKRIICLDTGKIFDSINQASRELKISNIGISGCCSHRHYSTNNLHFEYYLSSYDNENIRFTRIQKLETYKKMNEAHCIIKIKKPVICLDNKNIFDSAADASKFLKVDYRSISLCCLHKRRSAGGLHFEFYNIKEAN